MPKYWTVVRQSHTLSFPQFFPLLSFLLDNGRNFMWRLSPDLHSKQNKKTEKQTCHFFFPFLPNSLPRCMLLPTHVLLKTMAKTMEMLAQTVIIGAKQTKDSYLKAVTTSLLEKKQACTLHE